MSASVLRRIAAMPPDELRFRLACELRKTSGRLRSALAAPRWDRRSLADAILRDAPGPWAVARTALRAGDAAGAHRALAAHFATRSSAFPLNARDLDQIVAAIRGQFPAAPAEAVARAERVLAGQYDLLGYSSLALGESPDWHHDAIHKKRSPVAYWASVPFLDPAAGDHKVIWELNRHQHWVALGRAHALCGERRFYERFVQQLESWLGANPPLIGTNWASMLELAFRSIAWLWVLELFAPVAAGERAAAQPWIVDLLLALDRQLTHVEHNLSYFFSPNTHLTGEALALYVAGLSLPELAASARRVAVGRDVLVAEATRQVRADGGHAELSAHYHRYSTDFYLLAAAVATRAGDSAAGIFQDAALAQARYLRTICDDRGIRPQIGDDDGGQLFPICGRAVEDCRDTLTTASVLLRDATLRIGDIPEETFWMCGPGAAAGAGDQARWTSTALAASGYYVSRTTRGDHLVLDAGPHGFLNGGHAHADALSVTLSVAGRPLLIDPGTATYTMDAEVRNRFRSTMMHNTVVVDGRTQSEPRGSFHWQSMATAHAHIWRSGSDVDYVEGTHDGYLPRRHTRAVLAIHGVGWWMLDHVLGGEARSVEAYWHIEPAWQCVPDGGHRCRLEQPDVALALVSSADLTLLDPGTNPLAVRSRAYGAIEPAPVLRATASPALPATIATFIPAAPELAEGVDIEELRLTAGPGGDWHGAGFRVRWKSGAMVVLSAVEKSGIAARDTAAPAERWGTAELQTDARIAVLIDYANGRSEAVLVNGATVGAPSTPQLISLPRRVPLLRLASSALAHGVHEVVAK